MKNILIYLLIFALFLVIPFAGNHVITVLSDTNHIRNYVVLDAGHGGMDGGSVSCTGIFESRINLDITLKLNDLMHLLGIHTIMIRSDDRSVHTEGSTIAAKKISDIRNRVNTANTTPNALLISIHQNSYPEKKYSGAQVFYSTTSGSKEIAEQLQTAFRDNLNPKNNRQSKKASDIYLMEHINCTGILVECGFLSNPQEESMLIDSAYQKKICTVIATTVSKYLNT